MQDSPRSLVDFIYASTSLRGAGWGWNTPRADIVLKLRETALVVSKCHKDQLGARLLDLEGYAISAKVLGALSKKDLEHVLALIHNLAVGTKPKI